MSATIGVALAVWSGDVTATGITARQRYPWNGLVDVVVTLAGASNDVAAAACVFAAANGATAAALDVVHVARVGTDSGSGTVWTRRFLWNAAADIGEVRIDDVALGVGAELSSGGVQLWRNGPYWAECNVGATKPEEFGYYFWWGDTVGYTRKGGRWTYGYYSDVTWVSSKGTEMSGSPFTTACPTCWKLGSTLLDLGYIDSTGNLAAGYDAATAHLGAPWRMPTSAELDALISNCTTAWITTNGVSGRLVTGKGAYASKSIFLPAAGYGCESTFRSFSSDGTYWSSTPIPNNYNLARYLNFQSNMFSPSVENRYFGQSVRPLWGFAR